MDAPVTPIEPQIFERGAARYIYSFDDLPFSHILMIEEIFHFKRQQIARKTPRFDDVVSSGGADYLVRAASYLLLPCDANGEVKKPELKPTRSFASELTGKDVARMEECIQDFFTRRGKSDLESEVRSRDFLTLEDLVSQGYRMLQQSGSGQEKNDSPSSASETGSSDLVSLTDD